MKKLAFFICAAVSVYFISCTGQTASMSENNTSMEKKNLEADSIIGKAFETGDAGKIDSVVAADFVDHTDRGDMNRDSLKMFIKLLHDSMPGMKMEMINAARENHVDPQVIDQMIRRANYWEEPFAKTGESK